MERRREKGPPCCAPAGQERAPRAPTKGPRAESRQLNPVRENSTGRRAGGKGARSLPPTAPGNKMADPADMTARTPAFQAELPANQRRPGGLERPLPSSPRSLHPEVAAVTSLPDS
ncbi:PREDICTED: uncharacterized protein LOC105516083 [Colobus angolensis palliatus]|uniref:uncharacterized protein LOC105516083 n=1 Tax=Colobus angolensis palliatus TaxID=336983 RepID=UPI0005F57BD0|nr:PREDICTED: uncharacterized protein LOC105516083 [Colobus angolensis palliatus]